MTKYRHYRQITFHGLNLKSCYRFYIRFASSALQQRQQQQTRKRRTKQEQDEGLPLQWHIEGDGIVRIFLYIIFGGSKSIS